MNFLILIASVILIIFVIQVYLRKVWFYRDPQRTPEATDGAIIAPADGQVIYIKEVNSDNIVCNKLGQNIPVEEISKSKTQIGDGFLIGIYMSPLDVHFNYAPISGTIESMKHTQAKKNLPMVDLWEYIRLTFLRRAVDLFGNRYHLENERNTIFIKGKINIAMVEIADKFVNKISTYVKEGADVNIGQKLSFIERGSQVDLFIPKDAKVEVEMGQQVYGAQTVVASYVPSDDQKSEKEKIASVDRTLNQRFAR